MHLSECNDFSLVLVLFSNNTLLEKEENKFRNMCLWFTRNYACYTCIMLLNYMFQV